MLRSESQTPEAVKPFISLGVDFSLLTESQCVGTCPFCGKEEHFFTDSKEALWDCKVCGLKGNIYTFITLLHKKWLANTTREMYRELADERSLPYEVFVSRKLAFSGENWAVPVPGKNGSLVDLRRWINGKLMTVAGCKLHLYGLPDLVQAKPGQRVWICEGEWDAMALSWLMNEAGRTKELVVGVPGAGTFKKDWVEPFKGLECVLCYDNDHAGDEGSSRAGKMLKGTAKNILYLNWPDRLPKGYDLRDIIKSGIGEDITAEQGLRNIEDLVKPYHRRNVPKIIAEGPAETPLPYSEVVKIFKRWTHFDPQTENALIVSLATCLATGIIGDPIWLQLVAPPSSGKTLILMSLKTSDRIVFRSTLTPASLVSGFNIKPDPSLIPQLDNRCAVFKDGTELLALHPDARGQIYGVLRGAFDGQVDKSFGNGVERHYHIHFDMLMGVTDAIKRDSNAHLGERFLRFEMRETPDQTESKIRAAIANISRETRMEEDLCEVCRRFLLRKVTEADLPPFEKGYADKFIAISQILSLMRARVEREPYGDRDIIYRPAAENGARIAKQLAKLAKLIAITLDHKLVGEQEFRIVDQIVNNTSIGYHLDIMRAFVKEQNRGLMREEIQEITGIKGSSLIIKMEDMEALGIIHKRKAQGWTKKGTVPLFWRIGDGFVTLWNRSRWRTSEIIRPKGVKSREGGKSGPESA